MGILIFQDYSSGMQFSDVGIVSLGSAFWSHGCDSHHMSCETVGLLKKVEAFERKKISCVMLPQVVINGCCAMQVIHNISDFRKISEGM